MAHTLLIGLGGTGSSVVGRVVEELKLHDKSINDGKLCCAVLDTDRGDSSSLAELNPELPVFSTSKGSKIKSYFDEYRNNSTIENWCPKTSEFLSSDMLSGASEMRVKSRLAFKDSLERGTLEGLRALISEIIQSDTDAKIQAMIVTSLAGGTGSGMVIQVALWLRKIIKNVSIRGLFLLPDIFASTYNGNYRRRQKNYANAYAVIRELNALDKIKKGTYHPSERILIDDFYEDEALFDSDRDFGGKNGVQSQSKIFNMIFFLDDQNDDKTKFNSKNDYERVASQIVYSMLYSALCDEIISQEDNLFVEHAESEEPLYGACGTAKAVYPLESVKEYCAIRMSQETLEEGWLGLDEEVKGLEEAERARMLDGLSYRDIDRREKYVELFDRKSDKKSDEIGIGQFQFYNAIKSQIISPQSGRDKATSFKGLIDQIVIRFLNDESILYKSNFNFITDENASKKYKEKKNTPNDIQTGINSCVAAIDKALKLDVYDCAEQIADTIIPLNVEDLTPRNDNSIYGFLTYSDNAGNRYFAHPVAARYLLYKLNSLVQSELKKRTQASLDDERKEASIDAKQLETLYDNPYTRRKKETTLEEFLKNKLLFKNQDDLIDIIEDRMITFFGGKFSAAKDWQTHALSFELYKILSERLQKLIKELENFFEKLKNVKKRIDFDLKVNITSTGGKTGVSGKILYLLSTPEKKEEVYQLLKEKLVREGQSTEINKSVIDTIFGLFCAKQRPSIKANAKYLEIDFTTSFTSNLKNSFLKTIESPEINASIDMGVFKAIEIEMGGRTPLADMKKKLLQLAKPILERQYAARNSDRTAVGTEFQFFGYAPELAENDGGKIERIFDVVKSKTSFSRNELICYQSCYGIPVYLIDGFNELNNGIYYRCYRELMDRMIDRNISIDEFIDTPHLDKRWHILLPYATPQKQKEVDTSFWMGFWLAIAYGWLITKKENVYLHRVIGSVGDDTPITYLDEKVSYASVAYFLKPLKEDKRFTDIDIPELLKRFDIECKLMNTYVGTNALKGLLEQNKELHPIDLISRYFTSSDMNLNTVNLMIQGLEGIAFKLAQSYKIRRDEKKLEEAKYSICKMIYDSSDRKTGKEEIFGEWLKHFRSLPDDSVDEETDS